jgi:DNA polymerase III delta subunit
MKFQALSAFQKHLFSESPVALVALSGEEERRRIMEMVVEACLEKEPLAEKLFFDAEVESVAKITEALMTPSLISPLTIIAIDKVDKVKKGALERLAPLLFSASGPVRVIVGCSSTKKLDVPNRVTTLDLSDEKPWEKKERLTGWLVHLAQKEKKGIGSDGVAYLLEEIGAEMVALESELIKLITYVGERQQISLADVKAVVKPRRIATIWEVADATLLGKGGDVPSLDLDFLLPLIGQLRNLFQTGEKIVHLFQAGSAPHEIGKFLPEVKSQTLQKLIPLAKQKDPRFFRRGLSLLFEMELKCKSTQTNPALLFDLFRCHLHAAPTS